jgi:tetratricopeptide (TPR) repeat protein
MSDQEIADAKLVDQAATYIQDGHSRVALRLLTDVHARIPADYRHSYELDDAVCIKFWSLAEFIEYAASLKPSERGKRIDWVPNAYPRACYYLGYLSIEAGDFEHATEFLDQGLRMEPGNAKLANEKAQALVRLRRLGEAKGLCDGVLSRSGFVCKHDKAVALRTKGFILIEAGQLNEAEAVFRQSLEHEPENALAAQELAHIAQLRAKT